MTEKRKSLGKSAPSPDNDRAQEAESSGQELTASDLDTVAGGAVVKILPLKKAKEMVT